jgi:hypothetical protein
VGGFNSFVDVTPVSITAQLGERPMSKVWTYAGKWWAVLATSGGTKIFRLDGTTWTAVLTAHTTTDGKADVIVVGSVTHILIFRGTSNPTYLVSIEYVPATNNYKLWSQRPNPVSLGTLGSGVEAATLTIDGNGRMWAAWDGTTDFRVVWSDFPYSTFSSTIIVASGATTDDICAIVALPGKVGLFWSDQNAKRFGFKTHTNGADPSTWSANEVPASQSAINQGHGMADDHMNLVCASDGTLYCAVKTSYDIPGQTLLGLLIRRPSGTWDNIYPITANEGTRPQIVLNEKLDKIKIIYSSRTDPLGGEDVMYRESSISNISFSRPYTLIGGDLARYYNYTTTTHQIYSSDLVLLADDLVNKQAAGIHATDSTGALTTTGISTIPTVVSLQRQDDQGPGRKLELIAAPNPFESNTTISFIIPDGGAYSITLFSNIGAPLQIISQGRAQAGARNVITLNGSRFAAGIYLLKLQTSTEVKTIKLVINR